MTARAPRLGSEGSRGESKDRRDAPGRAPEPGYRRHSMRPANVGRPPSFSPKENSMMEQKNCWGLVPSPGSRNGRPVYTPPHLIVQQMQNGG